MTFLLSMLALTAQLTLVAGKATVGLAGAAIYPAEVDGNPATREWIANGEDPAQDGYGLIRVIGSDLCMSSWIDARPNTTESFIGSVVRVGGVDLLVVQSRETYAEFRLPVPTCGS